METEAPAVPLSVAPTEVASVKEESVVVKDVALEPEFAFGVILPAYGEFKVIKSANAWWMDTRKVSLLFDGYKAGATDEAACINATISLAQLRYFREIHPDFPQAKQACKSAPMNRYLNALHQRGPDDLPTIRWYLSKMHPDFKTVPPVEGAPVVQQSVNVQVNQNVDTTKIEEVLTRAAERFITDSGAEGIVPDSGGPSVEATSA